MEIVAFPVFGWSLVTHTSTTFNLSSVIQNAWIYYSNLHSLSGALNFSCCKIDIYKCIDMHVLRSMYTYHYRFYIILVSIFFAPMRLHIYMFDWFCLELMQKHWVLILHLKTKYINRCQFIWWTIRQRLLAFLSLSSIAPPEIISSLPKSYFQIANSPIK